MFVKIKKTNRDNNEKWIFGKQRVSIRAMPDERRHLGRTME